MTLLKVPDSSINLYGAADQWEDFLKVNATIPKELDVQLSFDGVNFTDYHAVRIGEYYWLDENLHNYVPRGQWSGEIGEEVNYPMTQARLNKYMPFVYLDSLDYQVNIDDFNKSYGIYYHPYTAANLDTYWEIIYNSGKKEKGWGLPTEGDARQLFAMAPSFQEPYVNAETVTFGLGAHLGDNAMAFDIAPKTPGSPYETYWFTRSTKLTSAEDNLGFKLMPNGAKLPDPDCWKNNLTDPFTGADCHQGDKADIYHLFYTAGFWLKNQQYAYIHAALTIGTYTMHWMGIRYTRRLTDEELGYKLYKNDDKEDIVQLGLTETPPTGYTELEPGYLRGYYVKYIIEGKGSGMTPKDLYYKLKYYTEKSKPAEATTTRSLVSEEVAVPFKTDATVSLYPNPVQDVLNILENNVEKVTIYDMSGRQVSTASNVNTLSVSNLSKGTYLVRVLTANGESTHKVVKK